MSSPQRKRRNRFKTTVYQSGLAKKIFERDGYKCRYCSIYVLDTGLIWKIVEVRQNELLKKLSEKKIGYKKYLEISSSSTIFKEIYKKTQKKFATIDHVVPIVHGGTDEELNLVTACFSCNCKKGKKLNYE